MNRFIVPPVLCKYTLDDNKFYSKQSNKLSTNLQQLADRVLAEGDRIIDETRSTTEQCKKDTDFRLKERTLDIQFLIDEAQKQKQMATSEESVLKQYRQRLYNAAKYLKQLGIQICQQSIILREGRLLVDNVNDEVDKELRMEMKIILSCQSLLDRTFSETCEQIRRLRAAIYLLDRDLSNKFKSLRIDENNVSLQPFDNSLQIYKDKISLDLYNTTYEEWKHVTNTTMQNTAKELNSAQPLRAYVDIILKQFIEDISNQVDRTNASFMRTIAETKYAKTKLEEIHKETTIKVNKIEKKIEDLECELQNKKSYLALAQTRVLNRAQRPGIELCSDGAHDSLMKEIETLRQTVGSLSQMLSEAKATLRYLLHTQRNQEEDIQVKTTSLKIDEIDCMTIRQGLSFDSF